MHKPKKILIIKTGYSEFLDRGISTTVSLGDILFCTVLLHLYKNDHVTWITAWQGRELLLNNPWIKEVLIFGPQLTAKIKNRSFDQMINLEKDVGICTYFSHIRAKKRYGFYFNEKNHDIATFNSSARYLLAGQENHRNIDKNVFEILYETVGQSWDGQSAVLKPPAVRVQYDIGFNHAVGSKWPTKAWPESHWKSLESLLKSKYSVSWQQGFSNLNKYIRWIASCRVIVTSDSLGQILGHALGKQVISLYGPTDFRRIRRIAGIHPVVSQTSCPHMPCYLLLCKHTHFCMQDISPKEVALTCQKVLAT